MIFLGVLSKLVEYKLQYEGIYRILLGRKTFIVITNPDICEHILTSKQHMTKADVYKFTDRWLGESLLTANGNLLYL